MKNKKLIALLSIFTAIVLSVTTVVAISMTRPAVVDAKTVELADTEYEDSYKQGTTVTFKDTIVINPLTGDTAGDGEVKFPNGKIYPAGTFTLNDLGTYTLRYYKSIGGEFVTYEKSFKVCESLYELSAENGSYIQQMNTEGGYKSHTGLDGIVVNLKDGCSFNYNKPIDLKAGTTSTTPGGDVNLANIISLDPRTAGAVAADGTIISDKETYDAYVAAGETPKYQHFANDFVISLTDCYDPSIRVDITMFRTEKTNSSDYGRVHVYVGSSTQEAWGVRYGNANTTNEGTVVSFDIDKAPSTANKYGGTLARGAQINGDSGSSVGAQFNNYGKKRPVIFQYDFERNRIYYTYEGAGQSYVIGDLDNPTIYPEGTFQGFTTGEVYLSFKASNYAHTEVNIETYSVGNDDKDVLIANIDKGLESYSDERAPVINVDAKLTVEKNEINDGYVFGALNSEFTIPSAQAFDMNLIEGSLKVGVYRNYGTANEVNISVNNGKFKIDAIDTYTIVYTAVDESGNVGLSKLDVKVRNVPAEKGIYVAWDNLDSFKTFAQNGIIAGMENELPAYSIETINLKEELKYKTYIKNAFETIEIGSDNMFVPRYTGDYDLVFEYSDNAYSYKTSYTLKCTAQEGFASFLEMPNLQRYYIKDAVYNIDEISAYTYGEGDPVAYKPDVYAIFDGDKENRVKIENLQKVAITGSKTVQFVLEFENATHKALPRYTQEVEIVDVGFGKGNGGKKDATDDEMYMLYKYFKYDDGAFTVQTRNEADNKVIKDIVYRATNETGNAKLEYINPIPFHDFTFIYKVTTEYGNFSTLRLTFTSTLDRTKKSVIDIYQEAGFTFFTADGSKPVQLKTFDFASTSNKRMEYKHTSGKIYLGQNIVNYKIPFDYGSVDFDIELIGIKGNAGILVSEICGQTLNNSTHDDKNAPKISFLTSRGNYAPGSVITITPASFGDVLSPIDYSKTTFEVKGPDQQFVTAIDGTLLNEDCDYTKTYQIVVDKPGQYTVTWKTKDISFASYTETYYPIICYDLEAPVITFKDGRGENSIIEMKMSDVIKLDYEITDNVTPADKLVVFVNAIYVPTQSYGFIDLGNEFNLRLYGEWIVYVTAYDENWNMAIKSFTVKIV